MPALIRSLSPWTGPLPSLRGSREASLIVPIPLDPYAPINSQESLAYLETLREMLRQAHPGRHEILLVPYGDGRTSSGELLDRWVRASASCPEVRWVGPEDAPGSAVRAAVMASRGRRVLVANLESLHEADFFRRALQSLGPRTAGVLANRRLPESEFTVPSSLLHLVYRRHLWGTILGRLWSFLFRLPFTDSLSGAYVLRRDFALRVFTRITCPGFLYEAEMAVLAKANRIPLRDLTTRFFLEREKRRWRIYREIVEVVYWTWRFARNLAGGEYAFLKRNGNHFTADDWGMSPGVNEGILEMARLGHLRRVSVLAGGPFLDHRLAELKRVPGIEFGLHFNLTNPESGGAYPSLARFLRAWTLARLTGDRKVAEGVRSALREQFALLRRKGIVPRRVEGHHHVHAVPGLLAEIADILREEGVREVRVPYHASLWAGKKALLAWFGRGMRGAIRGMDLAFLPFCYPGRRDFLNLNRMVRCLNRAHRSEVLVHPSRTDDIGRYAPSDPYRRERVREFQVLRLLTFELAGRDRRRSNA